MITPKTDAELLTAYRALVDNLRAYNTVSNCPLSDEERIWFVRRFMGEAEIIAESEPFLRGALVEALGKSLAHHQALNQPRKTETQ